MLKIKTRLQEANEELQITIDQNNQSVTKSSTIGLEWCFIDVWNGVSSTVVSLYLPSAYWSCS
ncbi:hypothetical protein Bca101_058604 [Brassica carinata]